MHTIFKAENGYMVCPFCTNEESCYIEVKFLHQLQNLYFTITGWKELNYDEKNNDENN